MKLMKMKELSQLSDTPKSTILYYIKEGLLPEPRKVKANLSLYDETYVERIRFIKYLQINLGASIEQIKDLIKKDSFDFSEAFKATIETIEMLTSPANDAEYDENRLCLSSGLDCDDLDRYVSMGAISKRGGHFGVKEMEIADILKRLENIEGAKRVLTAYLECARHLGELEADLAVKVMHDADADSNDTARTLLDATLILKPYIMNMTLVRKYLETEKGAKNGHTAS